VKLIKLPVTGKEPETAAAVALTAEAETILKAALPVAAFKEAKTSKVMV